MSEPPESTATDDYDALEFYLERSAIIQFDAGREQHNADFSGVCLTRRYFARRGIPEPRIQYFDALRLYTPDRSEEEGKAT